MAVGSMNPLHVVNWRQDGTRDCRFALADFDAKAPKNDKTLCKSVRRRLASESVDGLTSPAWVVSTNRPPALF